MEHSSRNHSTAFAVLMVACGTLSLSQPAQAQIWEEIEEQAAVIEQEVKQEVRQVVHCVFDDTQCMEQAKSEGKEVVVSTPTQQSQPAPPESATAQAASAQSAPPQTSAGGLEPPAVGDGEYAFVFSPPFDGMNFSGKAYALQTSHVTGVATDTSTGMTTRTSITFCMGPQGQGEGNGVGGIGLIGKSMQTAHPEQQWTLGEGATYGYLTVNIDTYAGQGPSVTFYVNNSMVDNMPGTLTVRRSPEGLIAGSLTGTGVHRSHLQAIEPGEPVQFVVSFRATAKEIPYGSSYNGC